MHFALCTRVMKFWAVSLHPALVVCNSISPLFKCVGNFAFSVTYLVQCGRMKNAEGVQNLTFLGRLNFKILCSKSSVAFKRFKSLVPSKQLIRPKGGTTWAEIGMIKP